MKRHPPDFDAEEQAFLREFNGAAEFTNWARRNCPRPDMLLAADAGALPEELNEKIVVHVASCSACSALVRHLTSEEIARPDAQEEANIRRRVFEAIKPVKRPLAWLARPLPVAAAVLLVFTGIMLWYRDSTMPSQGVQQIAETKPAQVAPVETQTAFTLEKAPLKLPASVLVLRGEGAGSQAYATELTGALRFYREEDYAEAARRLEPVAQKYPASAEARFYLAVSQLFLGENSEAAANLARAQKLDRGTLANDIRWYLAIASVRSGKAENAARNLEQLCSQPGEYSARACVGLRELAADSPKR